MDGWMDGWMACCLASTNLPVRQSNPSQQKVRIEVSNVTQLVEVFGSHRESTV